MRFLILWAAILAASSVSSFAQDGIYGSFLVGKNFINLQPLNTYLDTNPLFSNVKDMPSNGFTFGGEGHLVLGDRLIIGGRAFGVTHDRPNDNGERLRLTGGMGVGNLGVNLLPAECNGFRLYPQVGAGVSTFILQYKKPLQVNADGKSSTK